LNDDKWHVYEPIAIGNKNTINKINISQNSVSSSILDINQTHIDNAPESVFIGQQIINEKKLEDIFYEIYIKDKKFFLKIDAQGYEYQILEGASKILNQINGILVEVSLIELYVGQKKWLDIVKFIENNGFSLWSIDRGFTNKKNGRTLQVDMCFFKGK
jgi:FkbM family methyltransferase